MAVSKMGAACRRVSMASDKGQGIAAIYEGGEGRLSAPTILEKEKSRRMHLVGVRRVAESYHGVVHGRSGKSRRGQNGMAPSFRVNFCLRQKGGVGL